MAKKTRQITEKELDELDALVQEEDIANTKKMEYLSRLKDTEMRGLIKCSHYEKPESTEKKWFKHDTVQSFITLIQAIAICVVTYLSAYFVTKQEFSEAESKHAIQNFEILSRLNKNEEKLSERGQLLENLRNATNDLDKRVYYLENKNGPRKQAPTE